MACLRRLLILSLLALFAAPKHDDFTVASSVNRVLKNGTTSKKVQRKILENLPGRNRPNPRIYNLPKNEDASEAPTVTVKNGTTSMKLQREILNLLGLPRRPRLSLNTRLHGRKMSAPRYMMDLYNSLEMNASSSDGGFCCNNTVTDSRAVGADTIMSYLHHGKC